MRAGFAVRDISPPIGTRLNGFIARLAPSTGVDIPLCARALWLEDQRVKCLIVALDVLGLSTSFADRVVRELASRMHMPEERIVLTCIHTHSGPMTCLVRGIGEADKAYLGMLETRIVEAALAAAAGSEPVQVAWGAVPVKIGVNRREIVPTDGSVVIGQNPDGPVDELVRVLSLRGRESSIVVFTHACHAVCLGPQDTLISADFPGHAIAALERRGFRGMFLNGCAGNINPLQACQGPQAAEATGRRLAETVLLACENAEEHDDPVLDADSIRFDLPHDELPPLASLRAELDQADRTVRPEDRENRAVRERVQAAWNEWFAQLKLADRKDDRLPPLPTRISLLKIGRGTIVALPGDVFFEIGQRIAAELGAGPACVVGYSHGYLGYVPNCEAYALGGYEVAESHRYVGLWRISPAAEDVLRDQVRLLREQSPPR